MLYEARDAAFAASAATAAISLSQSVPLCIPICFGFNLSLRRRDWQTACIEQGMLRITLPANSSRIVVLEGRLTGLWAQELLRVARDAYQNPGIILDLQEVFYVDSSGEEALRILSRVGARFITDSAYGKDLCKRLRLNRIAAPEMRESPKGVAGARCHRPMTNATTADPSGGDVLGERSSGCRE